MVTGQLFRYLTSSSQSVEIAKLKLQAAPHIFQETLPLLFMRPAYLALERGSLLCVHALQESRVLSSHGRDLARLAAVHSGLAQVRFGTKFKFEGGLAISVGHSALNPYLDFVDVFLFCTYGLPADTG